MYCPECGNRIEGEINFCPKCGKENLSTNVKEDAVTVKRPNRPVGMVLIVLYCAFSGIILIIGGFLLLTVASQMQPGGLLILSLLIRLLGFFYLAMSYGLWTTQDWGIPFSKKILYLSILFNIISRFVHFPTSYSGDKDSMIFLTGVEIVIAVIIIQYLKKFAGKK